MNRSKYALAIAFEAFIWTAGGCGEGAGGSTSVLTGRVFDADTGRPVAGVEVGVAGGAKVKSAEDGSFKVSHEDKEVTVTLKDEAHATSSKTAPAGKAHAEVYVKAFDAKTELADGKGGSLTTKEGAVVEVPEKALSNDKGAVPAKASLGVAAVDPRKSNGVAAVPGDFDAVTKEGAKGKVSAESPLYVSAREGDKELSLASGKKLKASFPAHADQAKSSATLFHFDEKTQSWKAVSEVQRGAQKMTAEFYQAELDQLGWWTVGEFYDVLSCVHGCVTESDGQSASNVRVVVAGVDHFAQTSVYTDKDGCFALDVRAGAQISVSAQDASSLAGPVLATTSAQGMRVADGIDACQNLGTLVLESVSESECPLGFSTCGAECVNLRAGDLCEPQIPVGPDAAVAVDAGVMTDAAVMADAGAVVDAGAGMDASTGISDASLLPDASVAVCGDGKVDATEESCDDADNISGDGCDGACQVESGWQCPVEGASCVAAVCGDGLRRGSEGCDDGNTVGTDGCSASCQVQPGWTCPAPGGPCVAAICGDGLVAGTEGCDDGNNISNDGCSSVCLIEAGYVCPVQGESCIPT